MITLVDKIQWSKNEYLLPFVFHSDSTFDALNSEAKNIFLNFVYCSQSREFYYHDELISDIYKQRFTSNYGITHNITFQQLINSRSASNRSYYYYSGSLSMDSLAPIRRSFISHNHILLSSLNKQGILSNASINLWIGSQGVLAGMHYDSQHNIYTQMTGSKTFRLVAPRYIDQLEVNGRNHPYARHARRFDSNLTYFSIHSDRYFNRNSSIGKVEYKSLSNFLHERVTDSTLPRDLTVLEVTLTPGDILYIPPFWFHEVIKAYYTILLFYYLSSYQICSFMT